MLSIISEKKLLITGEKLLLNGVAGTRVKVDENQ